MENSKQSNIGKDVEITGTIKSAGSIQIDGKLDGEIVSAGDVIVGNSANIKGNINSNSVIIEGAIAGNIIAKDKIEMKSSARVNGDIQAKRLSVEDGVTFMGRSEVNASGAQQPPSSGSGPVPPTPAQREAKPPERVAASGRK